MTSNVGNPSLYEAGDQRTSKAGENQPDRFDEGKKNSHNPEDPKDERSIKNRLANAEKEDHEPEKEKDRETAQLKKDPTLPAISHGNKPSKGAQIDKEIQEEEEAILAKKGPTGPKLSN